MELPSHLIQSFSEAEQRFQLGNYAEAIALMDRVIPGLKGDILEADALNNKGYYLLHLAEWQRALESFEQAYLIDPGFDAVLNHLAWAAILVDNRPGALALMDMFEKTLSSYQALHNRNKALLAILEEEFEQAKEYLIAASEEDSDLPYLDLMMERITEQTFSAYPDHDLQADFLRQLLARKHN